MRVTPEEYQQMLQRLEANKAKPVKNKYRNKIINYHDKQFGSQKEYHRYLVLQQREETGDILNLECQVRYNILVNGKRICAYIADFVYEQNKVVVVEDVKGYRRKEYIDKVTGKKKRSTSPAYAIFRIKKKLMMAVFNIDILET